jgi:flagellar protein FliS
MKNAKSAANAYRAAAIENAPPLKVVHMLYQGALRFIDQAAQIDPEKEFEAFQEKINRADAIVSELRLSLDHEPAPELTDKLNALSLFVEDRLRTAFLERSPATLSEARSVLETLLDGWQQIDMGAEAA